MPGQFIVQAQHHALCAAALEAGHDFQHTQMSIVPHIQRRMTNEPYLPGLKLRDEFFEAGPAHAVSHFDRRIVQADAVHRRRRVQRDTTRLLKPLPPCGLRFARFVKHGTDEGNGLFTHRHSQ